MVSSPVLSVGGSEKSRFVSDVTRIETWKWTDLLQMLEVTTIGIYCSHVGSQALGKVATALLMCSCNNSSQMVRSATYNSSVVLGFG